MKQATFQTPMDDVIYHNTTREQAEKIFGKKNNASTKELPNGSILDVYHLGYCNLGDESLYISRMSRKTFEEYQAEGIYVSED